MGKSRAQRSVPRTYNHISPGLGLGRRDRAFEESLSLILLCFLCLGVGDRRVRPRPQLEQGPYLVESGDPPDALCAHKVALIHVLQYSLPSHRCLTYVHSG